MGGEKERNEKKNWGDICHPLRVTPCDFCDPMSHGLLKFSAAVHIIHIRCCDNFEGSSWT